MANQKQEVELLIKAGTEGLKSIGQLVKELEALGEDTGEASEKLEGLAGSLKGLRDQQKLVKQFADLKGQTKDLAAAQEDAKAHATDLGKALAKTEEPTKAQRVEFEKARKASKDADQAWQDNQQQLNGLRTSLSETGVSTSNLSDEQQRIKREISGVDEEISSVTGELTQMRDSAKEAAKGSKKLGDDVEESGTRVSKFRERLQGLGPVLGKIGTGLKVAGVALAGFVATAGASVVSLSIFSKSQAQIADELTNTGNALDVSREQLQLWRIAGDRVGLSGEKVSDILKRMTERLGEFSATGTGEAGNVLKRLNLDIEDLIELKPDEQMLAIANAIGEIGSKSEQVALLEKLASDASQLQPLLENNAAGLQKIFEEAQKDGAIYDDEELDRLNKANDVYNAIDLKLKGLTTRIGAKLAPAVAQATDKVLDLFNSSGAGDALVDLFTRLSESAIGFLEKLSSNSGSIADNFSTLTKTISFFGNTATAVFRGVQSIAAGLLTFMATGISNLMSAIQGLAFALNKIGVVSDSAYGNVAAKAEAARATVVDLAKQTVEYGKKSKEAAAAAIKAFEDTGTAAKEAGDNAEESVGTLTTLADNIKTAGEAAEEALRKQSRATDDARRGLSDYGVDVKEVMTGVTTEAQEAIDGVGKLAGKIEEAGLTSEQSAKAFKDGFSEAIEAISTKDGLEALNTKIESLGDSGEIGAEALKAALNGISEKTKEIAKSIEDDLSSAIDSAKTKEALTALKSQIKGLKEAGEVGAQGANVALEALRKKMLQLEFPDLGAEKVVADTESASEEVKKLADETEKAGETAEQAGEQYNGSFGSWFAAILTAARTSVSDLSIATRNLFERKIGGNQIAAEAETATEALARVETELGGITKRMMDARTASWSLTGSGLARWAIETSKASLEAQKAFYGQAVAMENLVEKIDSGSLSMDQLNRISARATNQFSLLDDQRLQGLQSAIDQARSKIESLNSSAESTLNSLQQRLADISGDTERAQQLQYEAERKRLQQELENARQAGADNAAADYSNALDQLQKINAIEQKNRREAENEREKAAADRARQQEQAERERQTFERQRNQPTTRTQPKTESVKTVTINLGGQSVRVLAGDEDNLIRALETARSTAL